MAEPREFALPERAWAMAALAMGDQAKTDQRVAKLEKVRHAMTADQVSEADVLIDQLRQALPGARP